MNRELQFENQSLIIQLGHFKSWIMKKPLQLKPQDVLILLKLLLTKGSFRMIDLAYVLGLSQSEVFYGLERLKNAQLLSSDKKEPLRSNVLEFLVHGLKYAFPASIGAVSRGMVTAHSMGSLSKIISSSNENKYVWADPNGKDRGQSITPLYRSVPFAAAQDEKLHELLALADAIRVGQVREQQIAKREFTRIINSGHEL